MTEYQNISKSIFLRIIIPKFMEKRQLFNVKNVCKNVKKKFKWTYGLFVHNYLVAVLEISITSLKSKGQF